MRTTISLGDDLAADIKRRAAQEGISVSALIERLVRAGLHAPEAARSAPPFRLITFGEGGLVEGVDLDREGRIIEDEDRQAGLDKAGR